MEELIRLKKAAKGEFAYALSKNLLKTISNLSMEVMSLNQMSLKDGEVPGGDARAFMSSVDGMIKDKLKEINNYKASTCLLPNLVDKLRELVKVLLGELAVVLADGLTELGLLLGEERVEVLEFGVELRDTQHFHGFYFDL